MFAKAAYFYLLRAPIIIGLVLFLFPIAAIYSSLSPLFENLFDLDANGTFLTTVLALITAWSILLTSQLVLVNGVIRFGTALAAQTSNLSVRRVWWFLLLAIPAIFAQFTALGKFVAHDMSGNPIGLTRLIIHNSFAIAGGALAAYLLAYFGVWLAVLLAPPGIRASAKTFPTFGLLTTTLDDADKKDPLNRVWNALGPWLLDHLKDGLISGLLDPETGYPLSGVWLAAAFASVTVTLYLVIDVYKRAHLGEPVSPFPALFFVLWLLLNANWVLSFLAFMLDRWRIPLVVPCVIFGFLASWAPSNDHYFEVRPGTIVQHVPPSEVLNRRRDKHKIVLVASAGGGIQAAAWTAQVLTGLQNDSLADTSAPDFASDVTVVSSVSGGAVGAMFFLNQYDPGKQKFVLPASRLGEIVDMAEAGSLDDTAWSLVYHDIPRLYSLFSIDPKLDRGYLLEQSWRNRGNINAYLSNWQEGVLDGWRPVTIFNSTFAESGEPLLFSTSEIQDRPVPPHRWNFFEKYRDADIPIVTAVRLAATFPFVSPAARALTSKPENHVVDGGYYDNYGVSSLVEWLYEAVGGSHDPPRVLIIQILSFPNDAEEQAQQNKSAVFQLYAPLQALFGVRSSSQLIRDRDELERLKYRWNSWGKDVVLTGFTFTGTDAPLSWQMNRTQRAEIGQQWQHYKDENYKGDKGLGHCQLLKVRCFINPNRPGCNAAGEPTSCP
jgi:Patatin-like phospholipase